MNTFDKSDAFVSSELHDDYFESIDVDEFKNTIKIPNFVYNEIKKEKKNLPPLITTTTTTSTSSNNSSNNKTVATKLTFPSSTLPIKHKLNKIVSVKEEELIDDNCEKLFKLSASINKVTIESDGNSQQCQPVNGNRAQETVTAKDYCHFLERLDNHDLIIQNFINKEREYRGPSPVGSPIEDEEFLLLESSFIYVTIALAMNDCAFKTCKTMQNTQVVEFNIRLFGLVSNIMPL